MKLKSLLVASVLIVPGLAHAQELAEGTDYRLLSPAQPTISGTDKVEVAEFFQYGCGGCYQLEPHLEAWAESGKPDNVELVRVHVAWNALAKLHAQAFYTAQALGKADEINAAFFAEIHRNRNSLETEAKLAAFFEDFGVSREDFTKTFNSFSVHTNVQRAEELTRRFRVSQTPTLIVEGKYVTEGGLAGSYANWFEIINQLAALEAN